MIYESKMSTTNVTENQRAPQITQYEVRSVSSTNISINRSLNAVWPQDMLSFEYGVWLCDLADCLLLYSYNLIFDWKQQTCSGPFFGVVERNSGKFRTSSIEEEDMLKKRHN